RALLHDTLHRQQGLGLADRRSQAGLDADRRAPPHELLAGRTAIVGAGQRDRALTQAWNRSASRDCFGAGVSSSSRSNPSPRERKTPWTEYAMPRRSRWSAYDVAPHGPRGQAHATTARAASRPPPRHHRARPET